ncbi:MAG: hypothetical protein JXB03_00410 [Spirochaetales bacterium]|nr:hypothetical protein [Spirochaetales bacterium]
MEHLSEKLKAASRQYSDYLSRVTGSVFRFSKDLKLNREFDREIKTYRELVSQFPEAWEDTARGEYCFFRVFSSTLLLKKFLKRNRDQMMESDVRITNQFMQNPWEYILFEVQKTEGTLVYARDALTGEDFYLESPQVAELKQNGAKLFFSLVFFNGEGYQTYGIIQYFKGVTPHDFEYFSRRVNSNVYETGGIDGVMNRFPVPFKVLFAFSEIPFVVHKQEEIRYCASVNEIPGFEVDVVEGYSAKGESGPVVKFSFVQEDDPLRSGSLYVNTLTGEVILLATSVSMYRELSDKLPFDFGPEPDEDAGLVMMTATEKITGQLFPGTVYDELFSDNNAQQEEAQHHD